MHPKRIHNYVGWMIGASYRNYMTPLYLSKPTVGNFGLLFTRKKSSKKLLLARRRAYEESKILILIIDDATTSCTGRNPIENMVFFTPHGKICSFVKNGQGYEGQDKY
jgi:hypothetical protein